MTWVQFSHTEEPLPPVELTTLPGEKLRLDRFRGQTNLVLLYLHGWDCPVCREVLDRFSAASGSLDAGLVAVFRSRRQAPKQDPDGLQALLDESGRLHRELTGLLEFDLPGELMMYVLNRDSVPVRAWIGAEADEADLLQKAREALDFILIQCPE